MNSMFIPNSADRSVLLTRCGWTMSVLASLPITRSLRPFKKRSGKAWR